AGSVLRDLTARTRRTAVRPLGQGVGAAVLVVFLAATSIACTTSDGEGPGIRVAETDDVRLAVDADGSGVETSRAVLTVSPVAVVSASDPASQARAASLAVGLRSPMFTVVPGSPEALTADRDLLGVDRGLGVGGAEVATDGIEVVAAPDGRDNMEELTGLSFAGELQIPGDRVVDHTV